MSEFVRVPETDWQDILDATRDKTGSTEKMLSGEVATAIAGIQTGGSDDIARALVDRSITEYRDDTIKSVGDSAFRRCGNLTNVQLPSAERIGNEAFAYCANIVSIDLPNATTAGAGAFTNCSSLVNLNLPKVSVIGGNCFDQCKELVRIVLPSLTTVTTNSNMIFRGCVKLKTLDTYISGGALASYALNGCNNLTQLILRGTGEICRLAASSSIGGTPIANGTGYVYVPRALLSDDDETKDYRRATNWTVYATQFRALEDYTVDGTITGELDESKI